VTSFKGRGSRNLCESENESSQALCKVCKGGTWREGRQSQKRDSHTVKVREDNMNGNVREAPAEELKERRPRTPVEKTDQSDAKGNMPEGHKARKGLEADLRVGCKKEGRGGHS